MFDAVEGDKMGAASQDDDDPGYRVYNGLLRGGVVDIKIRERRLQWLRHMVMRARRRVSVV